MISEKGIETLEKAEKKADELFKESNNVFYVYYERENDWYAHKAENQAMRYDVTDTLRPDDQYMYKTVIGWIRQQRRENLKKMDLNLKEK